MSPVCWCWDAAGTRRHQPRRWIVGLFADDAFAPALGCRSVQSTRDEDPVEDVSSFICAVGVAQIQVDLLDAPQHTLIKRERLVAMGTDSLNQLGNGSVRMPLFDLND